MTDRLQKPFLTVETGEAYQPIRLTYGVTDKARLIQILDGLQCLERNASGGWNWFWQGEVESIHFESIDTFERNSRESLRLGSLMIRNDFIYFNLPSFKRACLAVPFFHHTVDPAIANIQYADFFNKVYSLDERLPHGFSEVFKENELQAILSRRIEEYEKIQQQCEEAGSIEQALAILKEYTERESNKKLPFAERYDFDFRNDVDPDLVFLGFYIFLRGRELVAIRRWFGEIDYTLAHAADDAVELAFGDVGVDVID